MAFKYQKKFDFLGMIKDLTRVLTQRGTSNYKEYNPHWSRLVDFAHSGGEYLHHVNDANFERNKFLGIRNY